MLISVIIPAFNEEAYVGKTLTSLNHAKDLLLREADVAAEIIVVDNHSDDETVATASALGASVIDEPLRNIAKVRNSGAKASRGDVLVFVDADTTVPETLLTRIAQVMADDVCLGGALDTDYDPTKLTVRIYLHIWRIIGRAAGMAQGATQFCRRDPFIQLNGYDETLFMGEDVDFFWRLKRLAKRSHGRVSFVDDIKVIPSTRRFDRWRLWRTLVWTNPLFVFLFRRSKTRWEGWYTAMPR
jgi:glycosyltransferase involved in cell wall biosynthesis